MKISEKTREEAAVFCSAMACWWAGRWPHTGINPDKICDDTFGPARSLAAAAVGHSCLSENGLVEGWAEAEALIRTGWSPGDE